MKSHLLLIKQKYIIFFSHLQNIRKCKDCNLFDVKFTFWKAKSVNIYMCGQKSTICKPGEGIKKVKNLSIQFVNDPYLSLD